MTMSNEIKKKLPDEGVRWLYIPFGVKSIPDRKMNLKVLILGERMILVAIYTQVAQIISTM